jgi:hypothetical protein
MCVGNEASPEVIFITLLLVSTVLLYPASLPPLFQKLGFGVLAMTLFDSHNAELGRDHPWRLAWSGVLGCLIPLPICIIALPGIPPSLAHSAATKQLNLLAEACAAHHYAMVCSPQHAPARNGWNGGCCCTQTYSRQSCISYSHAAPRVRFPVSEQCDLDVHTLFR